MRPDVEAALKECKGHAFGNKGNIKTLEKALMQNETVQAAGGTNIIITVMNGKRKNQNKYPGFFFITNLRFLFSSRVLNHGSTKTVPLSAIQSVSTTGNNLTGSHLILTTASEQIDVLISYSETVRLKIQGIIDMARSAPAVPFQPAPPQTMPFQPMPNPGTRSPAVSPVQQLEQLAEMRDKGLISQADFETKKNEILQRM